tara:strand:- start:502 stop:1035 length:534 start_codon:yes stop_codon:yes gene_type:complete
MAEVEVGGVKFKGGKMLAVVMGLSTFVGGLYGAFEFYKDYMDMREKIESYTAPDLSGFDKKLAVMNKTMNTVTKQMDAVRVRVGEVQDIVRDTRQDVRADATKLYEGISSVDRRSRALDAETRSALRQAEKNIRDITESASSRFDAKINGIDSKLDTFEKRQDKKLRDALNNPLLKR